MSVRQAMLWLLSDLCFFFVPLIVEGVDELRIDRPQRAALNLNNGKRLSGKLISLNSKEVQFQPAGSTEINTYFVAQVKSVQTADDEFIYDADSKGFVSSKLDGKAADNSDRAAITKDSTGDKATDTVVAEGTGKTAKTALKDAFRNAVNRVVGMLVDAETQVKNDEVISDQILEYSGGFVASYDKISEKEDEGLIRVKIKAQIERRQVIAKLRAAKVTVRAVEGKDLAAEVLTQREARKNATAVFARAGGAVAWPGWRWRWSARGDGEGSTFQALSMIWSLIAPSSRACSVTAKPFLRASSLARSTAYICRNWSRRAWSPQWPSKLSKRVVPLSGSTTAGYCQPSSRTMSPVASPL
jgi:hypothetical protein